MARILLVNELGAGLGHVASLQSLAKAFRDRGHDCVFAMPDLRCAEEFLDVSLGPVLPAPAYLGSPRNPVKTQVSYSSLLNNSGYDDIIGLAARLRAWRELIAAVKPQLLVGDHMPTALLAARSLGLPRAQVGTGFTVPPVQRPFPVFQPHLEIAPQVLVHNESAVLQNLNHALARLRLDPLPQLQDLFEGAAGYIQSYAELDHYDCARTQDYCGLPDHSRGMAPAWPDGPGPKIFAYLRPSEHLDAVLVALARSKARVLLRVGDLAADKLARFLRPGLSVTEQPVHMRIAAQSCDAFVNYAAHGFTAEMLLAGRPGLLLPTHLEQSLLARRAQQLGAVLAPPQQGPFNLSQALERIVQDADLRHGAERFAARYRDADRAQIPALIVERLLTTLS